VLSQPHAKAAAPHVFVSNGRHRPLAPHASAIGYAHTNAAGQSRGAVQKRPFASPDASGAPGEATAARSSRPAPTNRRDAQLANSLHRLPAELLDAELQRRGWVVMEP